MPFQLRRYNSYSGSSSTSPSIFGPLRNTAASGAGRSTYVGSDNLKRFGYTSDTSYDKLSLTSALRRFTPSTMSDSGSSWRQSSSNLNKPQLDRSLSFASLNRGAVTSLRDKFDTSGYSGKRYDTYKSPREPLYSDRTGYTPSRQYSHSTSMEPSYSSSKSDLYSSKYKSPSKSSPYGGYGGSQYGLQYSGGPSSTSTYKGSGKYGGSQYGLGYSSGEDQRQKSSRFTLTPFSSRFSKPGSSDPPKYSSLGSSYSPKKKEVQEEEVAKPTRPKKWLLDDEQSSESAHESQERKKGDDIMFLTSRATSPLERDLDFTNQTNKLAYKNRRRGISRTKTKTYPKKVYRRRRDRPRTTNTVLQIEAEQIDRDLGIYRYSKDKQKKPEEKRIGFKQQIQKPKETSSGYGSYDGRPTLSRSVSADFSTVATSSAGEDTHPAPMKPVKLPKQSSFLSRNRQERPGKFEQKETSDSDASSSAAQDDDSEDERHPSHLYPLTQENISLKDSIDRVKSWKQQLAKAPPEPLRHLNLKDSRKSEENKENVLSPKSKAQSRFRTSPRGKDLSRAETQSDLSESSASHDKSPERNLPAWRRYKADNKQKVESKKAEEKPAIPALRRFGNDPQKSLGSTQKQKKEENDVQEKRGYINQSLLDIDDYICFSDEDFETTSEDDDESSSENNKLKMGKQGRMRQMRPRLMSQGNESYQSELIGETEDIDELLDSDVVEKCTKFSFCHSPGAQSQGAKPATTPTSDRPPLQQSMSIDSILDTPVPDTPDIPLSPEPAFLSLPSTPTSPTAKVAVPKTSSSSQKQSSLIGAVNKTAPTDSKDTGHGSALENLDDLDSILNTLSPTKRRTKRNESTVFELFTREAKGDLLKELTEKTETEDDLMSVSRQTSRASVDGVNDPDILVDLTEETPVDESTGYPPDYSKEAIRLALLKEFQNGTITTAELLRICRLRKSVKPPWIQAEEDKNFTGHTTVDAFLKDLGVDLKKLEDCALQLYKYTGNQGDFSTYLDLDASLEEQAEELEEFKQSKKNTIILRTKLSVRVHACIEKLLTSSGRDLKRALFSLKQIFQDDKDLVHEFVNSDGLECLIKVGLEQDQNYQNYILRALGQIMLYVDGMNGVIAHNQTIQWLYQLTASQFRLVVKTALKLLLVFVEYSDKNTLLLYKAVQLVARQTGNKPWANLMSILHEDSGGDSELLVYALTLINKTLGGIPDQDTFYDITDALEEQGMERIVKLHMNRNLGYTNLDLVEQLKIYENVLKVEDGDEDGQSKRRGQPPIDTGGRPRARRSVGSMYDVSSSEPRPRIGPPEAESKQETFKPSSAGAALAERQQSGEEEGVSRRRSRRNDDGKMSTANLSNNRRWMMYKLRHQEGEEKGSAPAPEAPQQQQQQLPSPRARELKPPEETEEEEDEEPRQSQLSGLLSKAKDSLSQGRRTAHTIPEEPPAPVVKKSDSDLQWEEIERLLKRDFKIANLDFTDLSGADDINLLELQLAGGGGGAGGIPPPPPPLLFPPPPPPPPPGGKGLVPPPPPPPGNMAAAGSTENLSAAGKGKKTLRLHWKEAQAEFTLPSGRQMDTIWKRMNREFHLIKLDNEQLVHLFESRTSEIKTKKTETNKKEIVILDPKRSNAINIGLTALPPIRAITNAITRMDTSVLNREGIEKIVSTMLPSEEEKKAIVAARMAHPDLPLGAAESFLDQLSSVAGLEARLQLWAFKLDYEGNENEVAEPLNDLKVGLEELKNNRTFKFILALLLQVGNFLNSSTIKGFTIDYLSKVPEVKDTVHKHSLLYHVVQMMLDQCPGVSDLYSEIGPIVRCSKVDFDELTEKLNKMERDCKSSWGHLRVIAKHDTNTNMKNKLSEFLTDAAERIIILKIVHKRILNRFFKFLLFLGYPGSLVRDTKPGIFCKVLTEFSLEYKTTREKALQQREKKANQRERKKTRGKLIVQSENMSRKGGHHDPEKKEEDKLQKLLHNGYNTEEEKNSGQGLPGIRTRKRYSLDHGKSTSQTRGLFPPRVSAAGSDSESLYETPDDEVLDMVVKNAAATPANQKLRTRARNRERKSLRRTLKTGLTSEELASLEANYSDDQKV